MVRHVMAGGRVMGVLLLAAALLCGVSVGVVVGLALAHRALRKPDDIDYSGGV